jgi:hypothetical protein
MKLKVTFIAILLTGLLATSALATSIARIDEIREGDLALMGFELGNEAEIRVEAVGICTLYSRSMSVYAWILNSETREPVWVMRRSDSRKMDDTKYLRQVDKAIKLPAGRYELYMFANESWQARGDKGRKGLSDAIKLFTNSGNSRYEKKYRRNLRKCFVDISSGKSGGKVEKFKVTGERESLFQFIQAGNDRYLSQPFELTGETPLHIYAMAELPDRNDPPVDTGWIINSRTRERVWEMTRRNTRHAGGHKKNRIFDDEVKLPAGKYILHYATDDSHAFPRFNTTPPLDPVSWGITLRPGDHFDQSSFHLVAQADPLPPLVDLTRIRDDDFQEESFELKSETELRIFALGEYSSGGREFVDYGWITDLKTGKTVWEMSRRNTSHAGGGDKNRQFDGFLTLPAGQYSVQYISDDSHAYKQWNVAAPFNPRNWGIAIHAGSDGDNGGFQSLAADHGTGKGDCLIRFVRVRDDERLRENFQIDRPTTVHILAIGEYSRGDREFVDYGWIENRNGRVVWEMTRRNTEYAGGNRKNRLFDDVINLEPGQYKAFYKTDGSHAFGDWNASRPDDHMNWGLTIREVSGD